jgi:hypothetical protein
LEDDLRETGVNSRQLRNQRKAAASPSINNVIAAVDIERLAGDQLGCVMRQNGGGDLVRLPVGLTKDRQAYLGTLLTGPCTFPATDFLFLPSQEITQITDQH